MKKLKFKEMATFASGDLFGGGAQLIIGFFYLRFLTDVVRINPILAGTVILLSKVWDAISDPLMGSITDNTRSKYGRRRPYLLAGFFLIVIAFTLLWYSPNLASQGSKFAFVVFSYMFYSTVSTVVMVPYTAMSSEISQVVKERDIVNGARLFFSQLSSLLGAVLPMLIVGMFSEKLGYVAMGLVFGLFYAVPFLGIFFWCKERTPIPKERTHFSIKKTLSPFKIKTYRSLIGMYLSAFFVMDVVSAIFTYYMTYLIGREDLLELVLGTMLLTQIVALAFVVVLAEKIGKPKTFILGSIIFIIGAFALGFYNVNWHIAAIFIISGVVGLGLIGCIVIPWIMFPDVTDISELAFGERRSGAFAGFMTFMRKFSSAIGIWVVGFMLQFSGYILPGDVIIPVDSKVQMNAESNIEIDMGKDGSTDIIINMNNEEVTFVTDQDMEYQFSEVVLTMKKRGEQQLAIAIQKDLKVSKAYDFGETSTMKSIKSFNQPATFIMGLRIVVFVLPGLMLLLAIFIAKKYPLTKDVHNRLLHYFKIKNGESDDTITEEEIQELKDILI
ncbi:MAG: MFS transporter [Spirochaetaceae bacterium]